jgi:uncharacterized Zn-binding protein involved in type VI secretion
VGKITRLADKNTGHQCWNPVPLMFGSETVIVNGKKVGRVGDQYLEHCCFGDCHQDAITEGSATVFANGLAVGRIGDKTGAAFVAEGSDNVIVG